jgi:hypothetical protein
MENQIKLAHELLKKCEQEPIEENAVALCKTVADLEPFESMAIMAVALRIKTTDGPSFKHILLTIPAWVEWARAHREHIDLVDKESFILRRNEIIQELGLNIEPLFGR